MCCIIFKAKKFFTVFNRYMNISSYRQLNNKEIKELGNAAQIFSDCYLVSSLRALAKTAAGQDILKHNIKISENFGEQNFKINFPYNNYKDIFITQDEIKSLKLTNKYHETISPEKTSHPILRAVEIAMNKLISDNPLTKPFICRLVNCNEKFEYNFASNFMEIFTGKKPYSLNEKTLYMSLKNNKNAAYNLFKRLGEEGNFNFIAGTGWPLKHYLAFNHCYLVDNVDLQKQSINILEPRTNKIFSFSFDEAIKSLKYFTGYFKNDLINH